MPRFLTLTDVAETCRTKQCVAHRMRNGIGITVPEQAALACEAHARKHERPIIVSKSVNVKTLTNAHGGHVRTTILPCGFIALHAVGSVPTRDRHAW